MSRDKKALLEEFERRRKARQLNVSTDDDEVTPSNYYHSSLAHTEFVGLSATNNNNQGLFLFHKGFLTPIIIIVCVY